MLRIARFVTRCNAPQGRPEVYSLADSIAREQVAGELAARLGPSLSGQAGVVRIRQLRVRIEIRGRSLDRRRLIDAWVRAICRQLFTALAYPHGGGHFEVERAPSAAHFRAGFIRDLLSGAAQGRWIYRGREATWRLPRAGAVIAVLREAPAGMADTLDALAALNTLEPAVAMLDDVALEEIFRAIAASGAVTLETAWPDLLASMARVLTRHPPSRGWRLDSRAQALRMFVLARAMDVRLGPRLWLTGLTALALLAENGELWTASPRSVEQICGRKLSPEAIALLEFARARAAAARGAGAAPPGALVEALQAAGLPVPAPVVSQSEPQPWLEFEGASLLLLTGPLVRQGWADGWRGVARQATLYALACAIRGGFNPQVAAIDPDAALFSGMFQETPAAGLRGFFADAAPPPGAGTDWPSAMEALAGRLVAWWTARVPGFRKASRDAMVRQFLTSPGRVRIEENRVAVWLAPQPVFVALRIASLDEPVESVPWFGGRRLEFRIEGL